MAPRTVARPHKLAIRLSDEEQWMCDALAERHGIDASGVMRQALRKWAREEGLVYTPPEPPARNPKDKPRR